MVAHALSSNLDAWSAVYTVLAGYRSGSILSTDVAVAAARDFLPVGCPITDDELVKLFVRAGTANKMAISFDHNAVLR
jgi:hypothetical protein